MLLLLQCICQRKTFYTLKKELDVVDDELDHLDDEFEHTYENGKPSFKLTNPERKDNRKLGRSA